MNNNKIGKDISKILLIIIIGIPLSIVQLILLALTAMMTDAGVIEPTWGYTFKAIIPMIITLTPTITTIIISYKKIENKRLKNIALVLLSLFIIISYDVCSPNFGSFSISQSAKVISTNKKIRYVNENHPKYDKSYELLLDIEYASLYLHATTGDIVKVDNTSIKIIEDTPTDAFDECRIKVLVENDRVMEITKDYTSGEKNPGVEFKLKETGKTYKVNMDILYALSKEKNDFEYRAMITNPIKLKLKDGMIYFKDTEKLRYDEYTGKEYYRSIIYKKNGKQILNRAIDNGPEDTSIAINYDESKPKKGDQWSAQLVARTDRYKDDLIISETLNWTQP